MGDRRLPISFLASGFWRLASLVAAPPLQAFCLMSPRSAVAIHLRFSV
jgi:hypothetical protein